MHFQNKVKQSFFFFALDFNNTNIVIASWNLKKMWFCIFSPMLFGKSNSPCVRPIILPPLWALYFPTVLVTVHILIYMSKGKVAWGGDFLYQSELLKTLSKSMIGLKKSGIQKTFLTCKSSVVQGFSNIFILRPNFESH